MSRIVIVDDSITMIRILTDLLSRAGYEVEGVVDPADAFIRILQFSPDLIILDVVMPGLNGYDFCRILRNDTRTGHLPIILLTSKDAVDDKVFGLEAGADDYITKPFAEAEVLARIKTHLRRAKQQKCFSPLTGLPGNIVIEEEIKKCLAQPGGTKAIVYLDLDFFKAYNDNYGFIKGDEMLRAVSDILRENVERFAPLHSFVGHIGGDDFIVLLPAGCVDDFCKTVIQQVEQKIPSFYTVEDRERGFVTGRDRSGREQKFPLVSVSIAALTNRLRPFPSLQAVGEVAAALKKKAKEQPGSVYVVDS